MLLHVFICLETSKYDEIKEISKMFPRKVNCLNVKDEESKNKLLGPLRKLAVKNIFRKTSGYDKFCK